MIFGALSNAAYRVLLHNAEAELGGGVKHPIAARRVRRRAAARRGLCVFFFGGGE